MKKSSKLACLFGLGLLSGLFIVVSLNVTNGADAGIKMDLSEFSELQAKTLHKARLKMLYLWDGGANQNSSSNAAWMSAGQGTLDVYNGLIVDGEVSGNDRGALIVVGGGQGNSIGNASKSGIAGGSSNKIDGAYENAAIGGGLSNSILGNDAIVAGGNGNKGNIGGVVLGGENNEANGVVLGGQGNKVGTNGLAMGKLAKGGDGSFVRNDGSYLGQAKNSSALIGTQRGVIISKGNMTPKAGVLLDVDGAVQIGNNATDLTAGVGGEIRSLNGCLYAHDGESWHILGKSSVGDCNREGVATTCEFGRVLLQEGDKVMAYAERYSRDICQSVEVTCKAGHLIAEGGATNYVYPSCFELNNDPYYISEN